MILWILDTDHVSLWLRSHPQVVNRLSLILPEQVAITVVTAEEQLRGRLNVLRRASQANQSEPLVLAYQALQDTLNDFQSFNLLPFTRSAHAHYVKLQQQRIRVGTRDLRIAAITLAVDGTVVTCNYRDFGQVPGLKLEDWTLS